MSELSLSPAADRSRLRSGPLGRRTARFVSGLVGLTLLGGCGAQVTNPPAPGINNPRATAATTSSPNPAAVGPDPKVLAGKLKKIPRTGIGVSGIVVLADDGRVLADRGADRTMAPASTMKLLTTLAVLDTLGPDYHFTTKVVQAGKGRLVLVGGGDPLLTDKASKSTAKPASLQALALATVAALKSSGVKRVSLGYDTSLFTGADYNPGWPAKWRSFLPRVSPLVIGSGMVTKWQSAPDPARTAAEAFAKRVEAAGVQVVRVRAVTVPAGAPQLASVESAALAVIVERTLRYSDNLAAEMLARHLALAGGRHGSFSGATLAVRSWLAGHGLWTEGMRLVDGSGLAASGRVTPASLAGAISLALHAERLAAVATGLPVAGVNGTLKDRFNDKSEKVGRGNVHAKTGTLSGVASLAGYLTTADGARLVFAAMANKAAGRTTAFNWLDRSAAALVRCGCH